jgi:hypothetical protein
MTDRKQNVSRGNPGKSGAEPAREGIQVNLEATLPPSTQTDVFERVLADLSAADHDRLRRGLFARGREVVDPFGHPIGKAVGLMVDRETAKPQWLAIQLATAITAAPITGLQLVGERAYVASPAALVLAAPTFEADFLSASVERALCRHYRCKPTRGGRLAGDEQRATSSRAFWASDVGERIGWLPGPRAML